MSEWVARRLDDFISEGVIGLGRGDIISKEDIEQQPGPYPIYSSSAHNNGKFGEYGKYMFDEELITWSVDGGGYFFYRPKHKYSVTNVCGYMRLRGEQLHPKFVYYSLANQHRYLTFDYTTKAHPGVIKKLYWLPDIPYSMQKKIARILSTIDEAIERTEALIGKYEQIKAGMMHDLFTRGLTADGRLRPPRDQAPDLYQQTPIGWIPKEWELVAVDELLDGIEQGWSPDCDSEPADHSEWGVLKTSAITWEGFDRRENKRLPKSMLPRLRFQVKAGDLLVTRAGPNSRVGVVSLVKTNPGNLLISDKIYRLVTKSSVSNEFLSLDLSSPFTQHYLDGFKTGLAESQTNISQAIVRKLLVLKPCAEEQKLICTILRSITDQIDFEKANSLKLGQQKSGLMHDLLTGKVPVTVVEGEVANV